MGRNRGLKQATTPETSLMVNMTMVMAVWICEPWD